MTTNDDNTRIKDETPKKGDFVYGAPDGLLSLIPREPNAKPVAKVVEYNAETGEITMEGINNTRIKDTLIESGNARESLPNAFYSDDLEYIPPEDENVVNLNSFKLEKEMPGFQEMMKTLQNHIQPQVQAANIERLAMDLFVGWAKGEGIYNVTLAEMLKCWELARDFFNQKPEKL